MMIALRIRRHQSSPTELVHSTDLEVIAVERHVAASTPGSNGEVPAVVPHVLVQECQHVISFVVHVPRVRDCAVGLLGPTVSYFG